MGKEGTTPLLFLFHLPLSCLPNLRSYFSQHLGRPAVLPCQQHLLLLHGQAARSVHGERLPEKGCLARLSSTTCAIAVTALNPAGHISPPPSFEFFSRTLLSFLSTGWRQIPAAAVSCSFHALLQQRCCLPRAHPAAFGVDVGIS